MAVEGALTHKDLFARRSGQGVREKEPSSAVSRIKTSVSPLHPLPSVTVGSLVHDCHRGRDICDPLAPHCPHFL